MQFPWNKFVEATGKDAELNEKVKAAAYRVIEDYPDSWPSKIVIGKETAKDTCYLNPNLKGWWDGMGSVIPVEIVEGDVLRVERQVI